MLISVMGNKEEVGQGKKIKSAEGGGDPQFQTGHQGRLVENLEYDHRSGELAHSQLSATRGYEEEGTARAKRRMCLTCPRNTKAV